MEIIRRAARNVFGYNSWVYWSAATFLVFVSTISKEEVKGWRTLKEFRKGKASNESPRSVTLRNLIYPIFLRPGTSDVGTVIDNIVGEEYGRFEPIREPEWMIDAGAYIGDTAAYFLSRFPRLKVVAVEPNPESYEMATLSLELYGERSHLLRKGLYSTDGIRRFAGRTTGASIGASGIEIERSFLRCHSVWLHHVGL